MWLRSSLRSALGLCLLHGFFNKEKLLFVFSDEQAKLDQRRQWLDNEVEKVLRRKEAMEALAEELKKREAIVLKKEALLAEKSELEIKKLRSSQVLSKVRRGKLFWLFAQWAASLQFANVSWNCGWNALS